MRSRRSSIALGLYLKEEGMEERVMRKGDVSDATNRLEGWVATHVRHDLH
jgi:hypothetical protein